MKNLDIREEVKAANLKLWQIAEGFGCNDVTFCKKLRREFTPEQKAKVRQIIADLVKEREEA